jgi:hypothetical protein
MNPTSAESRGPGGRLVWAAGLIVAAAAGVATAHGLYQVAVAARVPVVIGWLYPLITDGLALLAYAATARLTHPGSRRYAAGIVLLAAGLSGLAQAVNLTGGITHKTAPGGCGSASAPGPPSPPRSPPTCSTSFTATATAPARRVHRVGRAMSSVRSDAVRLDDDAVQSRPALDSAASGRATVGSGLDATTPDRPSVQTDPGVSSAADRARDAARSHYARAGDWPTARALAELAQVGRSTAGSVLKGLREARPDLHVVAPDTRTRTNP